MSYQCGLRKIHRFSVPIVVIGNITIGGNGKTPMVLWLVKELKNRGWKIGVVSRGYKGKSVHYPIVVNEFSSSDECGDESILIWKRTGVLVAVSPNRSDAVAKLLHIQALDIIISDDGLQHYALFRDIEWVVVNSLFQFGNGHFLPAGPMRENIARLNSVQAIITNGSWNQLILPFKIISMQLFPSSVVNMFTGEHKSLNYLRKVIAIAGIGYPDHFFLTLKKYGIIPMKKISFPNHYVYSEKILLSLVKGDEDLLMTEKDAVKCLNFAHKNWWYLRVYAKINKINTQALLHKIEHKIKFYKNK